MRSPLLVAAILVSDSIAAGQLPQYSQTTQFVFFTFLAVCLVADAWDFISQHRRRH